jgi:DUF4097 and DUF4098 domain-containing protein YvlB
MRKIVVGIAALSLACAAALAQEPIDERRTVEGPVELSIENTAGDITVRGWDRNEVEIKGTLGKNTERLEIESDGDDFSIRVILPKGRHNRVGPTELDVRVPMASDVEVNGVSSDVEVREISGELKLRTVSGDIIVRDAQDDADLQTVSGDIEAMGNVGELEAKTVSGDILASQVMSSAELETVSGDIEVEGQDIESLECKLVSGSIRFEGTLGESADVELECHSGNIILTLPKDLSAEFDCETFSGGISNEFGVDAEKKSKHGPGRVLRYQQGGGDADIELKTFSGNIAIKN